MCMHTEVFLNGELQIIQVRLRVEEHLNVKHILLRHRSPISFGGFFLFSL